MGTPEFPDSAMRWDSLDTGHYSPGRPAGPALWGVVHCTDNLASNEAEDSYAHTRLDASAHGYFDNDDAGVQTVLTTDRAWSAFRVGNLYGVHAEVTGLSTWTREQWLTNARQSIRAAAHFLADCARLYGWDLVKLTTGQVGTRRLTGFCGHVEITDAFGLGDHRDPGPGFPWDTFLADVHEYLAAAPTTTRRITRKGDDMPYDEVPAGFAFDEHGDWLDTTRAVPVPLPTVGPGEGQWGDAWLWLAATGDATVRFVTHAAGVWTGHDVALNLAGGTRGPLALPAGTDTVLVGRKRTAADDARDSVPVRCRVQYATA